MPQTTTAATVTVSPLHALLRKLIFAAVTGIWVLSDRRQAALAAIARMCKAESTREAPWRLCVYNSLSGLRIDGMRPDELNTLVAAIAKQTKEQTGQDFDLDLTNPVSVVSCLKALAPHRGKGSTLLIMENCEEDLDRRDFRQALETALHEGKQLRTFVIFLSGVVNIPPQLRSQIRQVEHPMPSRAIIENTVRKVCDAYQATPDNPSDFAALLGACGGMNEVQIEQALAEALVELPQGEKISPRYVALSKKEALAARGLSLWTGDTPLSSVVGLENAKRVFSCLLRSDLPSNVKRRGLLLLGIPGTGKSLISGACARAAGWQMLGWNPNNMKGSLQGETEANYRLTMQTIESQAREGGRLVLLIDEIDKLLVGMDPRSARSDGGVMAGIGGAFLSWLQDRPSDCQVFVVGTCNDAGVLNEASAGAFGRAGRFNATLFFDFPTAEQRSAAWMLYRKQFGIPTAAPAVSSDENMTPAEIAATCEAFIIYDCKSLDEARGYVPLVSVTAAEQINRLRSAAAGRYIDASRPGLFTLPSGTPAQPEADAAAPRIARPTRRPTRPGDAPLFGQG